MAGQYFGRVEQHLSRRKLGYILYYQLFLDRAKEVFYERKVWGEVLGYFFLALHIEVVPPMVVEILLSKGASVTMKQTSHPA